MQLQKGINIGNHFESARLRRDGTRVTAQTFVNPVKDWYAPKIVGLGFDHVRLPVRWSDYTDDENGFRIEPFFINAVRETVDQLLDSGLSVVLNVHHFNECMIRPRENADKLYAIWEQLSSFFSDEPDRLLMEIMNEPKTEVSNAEWEPIQNRCVKIIRKNNPGRTVLVGGTDWNGWRALCSLCPPDDGPILGTFHYYHPLPFTHQGARWSPENAGYHDVVWRGTEDERKEIHEHFAAVKEWSDKWNIPVNLGEFGAYSTADMESRARWTTCVRKEAQDSGFSFTYWEFNSSFGICDPADQSLREPLVRALLG